MTPEEAKEDTRNHIGLVLELPSKDGCPYRSLEYKRERFGYSPQLAFIFKNTLNWMLAEKSSTLSLLPEELRRRLLTNMHGGTPCT